MTQRNEKADARLSVKQTLAVGSGLLVAGMGLGGVALAGPAAPDASQTGTAQAVTEQVASANVASAAQTSDVVEGEFSFTQGEVTDNETIARSFADASSYLCGGIAAAEADVSAQDWSIEVTGDVSNPFDATVAELQDDPAVQSVLMGCSCMGNPADGKASINARVTGVSVLTLLDKAGALDTANTVTFTSADGYEVSLPLSYLVSHYCPIVFDVNGSPIAESVGGTNQLWLGSTSAKYFARNIVSIRVETRDVAPDAPDGDATRGSYANLPNVGVAFGGEVA